jgi:tetratricopeptide (TPR) repeat protein
VLLALVFTGSTTFIAAQDAPPPSPPPAVVEDPVAEQPPAGPDLSAATERIRAGAYEEAEGILAGLRAEFPDDPALLLMHGEVLLALGRVEDASSALERCVELDPQRPRAHFQLATALASSGQVDRALDEFAREIETDPEPAVKILAHLNRSMLLQQKKRWQDAGGELEAVLQLDPGRTEVYGDLATLYIQAGETDAAVGALERGKEAGFASAPHYYSLGARLYNSKMYDDAVTMLNEALVADPTMAEAERSLAAALEQLGRESEALEHLRRYLELSPDAPDADAVSDRIRAAENAGG